MNFKNHKILCTHISHENKQDQRDLTFGLQILIYKSKSELGILCHQIFVLKT